MYLPLKIPWLDAMVVWYHSRPGRTTFTQSHLYLLPLLGSLLSRYPVLKDTLSKWKQTQNPRDAQRKISGCSFALWNHNYFILNCAIVVVTNTQQQWSSLLPLFSSALPQPSLPLLRLATLPPFDRLLLKLTLSPRVRRSSLKLRMWVLSCWTTKLRFLFRRERMK